MLLGTVKISSQKQGFTDGVNLYFDKNAGKLIDSHIVLDKTNMRFRNATIDDKKTYKALFYKTCTSCMISAKFKDSDDKLGLYEVELSECGTWYQMYKV